MKRHSWEMKNFVPNDKPEVPLLMSAVDQQLSLAGDEAHLSPLAVIDKSALVDDNGIVGMSHDIDDVVDSVINDGGLPSLADLSDLPSPLLHPPPPTASTDVESASSLKVPGLTCVNNKHTVLVRLRRLKIHKYSSADVHQRVEATAESVDVVSVSESDVKSRQSLSGNDKQKSTAGNLKQSQNSRVVSQSDTVKPACNSDKSLKSTAKKSGAQRLAHGSHVKTESSVKCKSDSVSDVKKQSTEITTLNNVQYVIILAI